MMEYEDFHLTVQGAAGAYRVEGRGPGQIQVTGSFEWEETEETRAVVAAVARGEAPTLAQARELGNRLFRALFPRPVLRAFERVQGTLRAGAGLRLRLTVQPPEWSHLPWELLHDPDEGLFLAERLPFPLVRTVESGVPVAPPLTTRPLRVLHVQANPPDTPTLELERGEAALRAAWGARAEIHTLGDATPEALREALRATPGYHILDYAGHAHFDEARGMGALRLHGAALDGERFAAYLAGSSVRLVVLAACETGMDARHSRFVGIAHHLMRASALPAVVAMQFRITDEAAAAFTQGFHAALADGYPVDAATIEGRKAIRERVVASLREQMAPDWAVPALFLRAPDGYLFGRADEAKEPDSQAGSAPVFYQPGMTVHGDNHQARDMVIHKGRKRGAKEDD